MGGKGLKKRKALNQSSKHGKRACAEPDRGTVLANEFFFIPEMFLMELLLSCNVFTILTLAKTCECVAPSCFALLSIAAGQYARHLVKRFFATNLRLLVAFFVSDEHVQKFFDVLEVSASAIAGSVTSSVLTFPYRHRWNPSNLNIMIPRGHLFMWEEFLAFIGLARTPCQLGVDRKFQHTTFSHVVYSSKVAVRS
jgi:hypothetical protein